jgi:dTDP-4-dehydrorhamnose 3,5-epimerase
MKITKTPISGLLLIQPSVFEDHRGKFIESWNSSAFDHAVGSEVRFVQDNESISKAGVLRGLHFQTPPSSQGKLVRVSRGSILDVAVDLRSSSPTFGMHYAVQLDATSGLQFWIPEGFAHGFCVLSDDADILYKVDEEYSPENESGII